MRQIKKHLNDYGLLVIIGALLIFFVPRMLSLFGGPGLAGWKTNFEKASVSLDDILSGGVGRDGIPPIDSPRFETVSQATWLAPQSPVIAVEINGDARAYPLEVLTRHEIVNDEIGGTPVAVTFCPLCNSAISYDRRVEGQTLRFGVSGNLLNSDLIMWDDRTESWWQQLTGEAVIGDYTGTLLDIVPSQVVGFGAFSQRYPEGLVLSGDSGNPWVTYGRNPYVGYDSDPNPFLFRGTPDSRLFATERVLAGLIGGQPIAYSFSELKDRGIINDTVGDMDVVVFWQPGATSALDDSDIDSSRDVGMAALFSRELDGQTLSFMLDEGIIRDEQTGSIWNIFGEATDGELAGESLRPMNAFPHFWFAWAAFHPETLLWKP